MEAFDQRIQYVIPTTFSAKSGYSMFLSWFMKAAFGIPVVPEVNT